MLADPMCTRPLLPGRDGDPERLPRRSQGRRRASFFNILRNPVNSAQALSAACSNEAESPPREACHSPSLRCFSSLTGIALMEPSESISSGMVEGLFVDDALIHAE
ncbi:hypothetical protein MHYP_G00147100 [Metynnis hypsauchen]